VRYRLILLLLFAPAAARADEPTKYYSLDNDFIVEAPPASSGMTLVADYRLTIYLNFDGASLSQGPSDSKNNRTELIASASLAYPAMGSWTKLGGRDKGVSDIIAELKLLFMKVGVELVTTRPASGDYTMAMIGGDGSGVVASGGDAVGISPLDCKNSNKNDIVLIFAEKLGGSAKDIAYVIAHELGHSFGLEHVEDATSIMAPALTNQTCCWTVAAVQAPATCGRSQQDDERVLLENVGAGPGDTTPPRVWFSSPGDGAVLAQNFSITADAIDDLRIHHVTLYLDGQKKLELPSGPYAAFFSNLPVGEHVLKAEAVDWKPNTTSVEIKVTVDPGCMNAGTCSAGKLALGGDCQKSDECSTGICGLKDGAGRCSLGCEGAGALCPKDTACTQAGESWICAAGEGWTVEKAAPSSGGCAAAASAPAGGSATGLLLLLALLSLVFRRARR
jgi:hypothetical protein